MASIDLGSGSPREVLSGVVNFISGGGKIGTLLQSFIFGIGASIFLSTAQIIGAVGNFIATPFSAGGQAIGDLFSALISAPAGILQTTAAQSAQGIARNFPVLAFLVGVAVVLGALWMINKYRAEDETGDTIVGLPFDVPDVGPFQIGTEEEAEPDE